jgi:hypothetical protein
VSWDSDDGDWCNARDCDSPTDAVEPDMIEVPGVGLVDILLCKTHREKYALAEKFRLKGTANVKLGAQSDTRDAKA